MYCHFCLKWVNIGAGKNHKSFDNHLESTKCLANQKQHPTGRAPPSAILETSTSTSVPLLQPLSPIPALAYLSQFQPSSSSHAPTQPPGTFAYSNSSNTSSHTPALPMPDIPCSHQSPSLSAAYSQAYSNQFEPTQSPTGERNSFPSTPSHPRHITASHLNFETSPYHDYHNHRRNSFSALLSPAQLPPQSPYSLSSQNIPFQSSPFSINAPCPGITIQWPAGSVHSDFPHEMQSTVDDQRAVGFIVLGTEGATQLRVRSFDCNHTLVRSGESCANCSSTAESEAFMKLSQRAALPALVPNTPWKYLTPRQARTKIASLTKKIDLARLQVCDTNRQFVESVYSVMIGPKCRKETESYRPANFRS
jgi:hypothetical protein